MFANLKMTDLLCPTKITHLRLKNRTWMGMMIEMVYTYKNNTIKNSQKLPERENSQKTCNVLEQPMLQRIQYTQGTVIPANGSHMNIAMSEDQLGTIFPVL